MSQATLRDARHATLPAIVPAYFHPARHPELWELLVRRADSLRLVVVNLASGPGPRPDRAHDVPIGALRAAGVSLAGYVDTDYGRRPTDDALEDLRRYVAWYGLDGVCFDQVAADPENVAHYASLAHRARELGAATVLFNHGTVPDRRYAEHADVLGSFEGTWATYQRHRPPRWTRRSSATMYHVVHTVPPSRLADAARLAVAKGAGAVYLTDGEGANPYDRLPADWLEDPR